MVRVCYRLWAKVLNALNVEGCDTTNDAQSAVAGSKKK